MSFQMNLSWCKYYLHSMQGNVDRVHFSHFKTNWVKQVIRGRPWYKNIVKYWILCTYLLLELASFLRWIETDLSFSNSSLKEQDLSAFVIIKSLSCNVLVFLPSLLLWNITKLWYNESSHYLYFFKGYTIKNFSLVFGLSFRKSLLI